MRRMPPIIRDAIPIHKNVYQIRFILGNNIGYKSPNIINEPPPLIITPPAIKKPRYPIISPLNHYLISLLLKICNESSNQKKEELGLKLRFAV
jgi:hypothetical protein